MTPQEWGAMLGCVCCNDRGVKLSNFEETAIFLESYSYYSTMNRCLLFVGDKRWRVVYGEYK